MTNELARLRERAKSLIRTYDIAMASQTDHSGRLAVIGNYGEIALNHLRALAASPLEEQSGEEPSDWETGVAKAIVDSWHKVGWDGASEEDREEGRLEARAAVSAYLRLKPCCKGLAPAHECFCALSAPPAPSEAEKLKEALRQSTQQEFSNARRMRAAIVEARERLAKGRPLWNGPCHECDSVLAEALSAFIPLRSEHVTGDAS